MIAKIKPQSDAILADISELGSYGLATLSKRLDRYGQAHKRALLMSNYVRDRDEIKLARKLNKCGDWLVFRHYYTEDDYRLRSADFCKKHLLCPFCAIRRGAKYLKSYLDKVSQVVSENPGLKAYMVTLTIVDREDLMSGFEHLRKGMKAMTQARRDHLSRPNKNRHVEFAKAVGGVHSIEMKRGSGSGLWHPHTHMIWLCYEEPDAEKLSAEWRHWTGDSFIVDVRPFDNQEDLVSGFLEVFKYALKFADLALEDNWEAFKKLSNKRLVDAFGLLRGVEVPEDLGDEMLDDLPYVDLFFKWGGHTYGLKKSVGSG